MAYYDHMLINRKKECADKYFELKKHITSKDETGKFNEWFLAHQHMLDLEKQLEEQERLINEYQSFFSMMKKLLPKDNKIYK